MTFWTRFQGVKSFLLHFLNHQGVLSSCLKKRENRDIINLFSPVQSLCSTYWGNGQNWWLTRGCSYWVLPPACEIWKGRSIRFFAWFSQIWSTDPEKTNSGVRKAWEAQRSVHTWRKALQIYVQQMNSLYVHLEKSPILFQTQASLLQNCGY